MSEELLRTRLLRNAFIGQYAEQVDFHILKRAVFGKQTIHNPSTERLDDFLHLFEQRGQTEIGQDALQRMGTIEGGGRVPLLQSSTQSVETFVFHKHRKALEIEFLIIEHALEGTIDIATPIA